MGDVCCSGMEEDSTPSEEWWIYFGLKLAYGESVEWFQFCGSRNNFSCRIYPSLELFYTSLGGNKCNPVYYTLWFYNVRI